MFRNVTFRWIGRKERPEGVDEKKGEGEENNSSGISLLDNKTSSPPQYISASDPPFLVNEKPRMRLTQARPFEENY